MGSQDSGPLPFPAVSRRGFLAAGGAGVVGLSLKEALAGRSTSSGSVIQIVLSGGASHLETFDPKPHAPREIRGPLHSIATRLPGVRFSECLPRLAERADELVILRSLYHDAAPIHATGLQMLLTGGLVRKGFTPPHIGFIVQHLLQDRRNIPAVVELGGAIGATGTHASSGESSGLLANGDDRPPLLLDEEGLFQRYRKRFDFSQAHRRIRDEYGETRFGELFWKAVRLIESGVRYVPVNTFNHLEGELTWDAHACPQAGPATIFDYGNTLGPAFDRALSAMLSELQTSGLIQKTLVVVAGEMGRSPRINERGGRDHWTQAWSGILAGGMLRTGQVIGETDEHGESILNSPLSIAQLPALILEYLGIPPGTEIALQNGTCFQTPQAPALFS